MSNSQLFVGNLSHGISEGELRDMFAAHGNVATVKVMTDRETGRPRGFAFVTMDTPEAAQTAMQALNGRTIGDRRMTVSEARPREERPAFNRSGGERRGGGGERGGGGDRGGRRY
jgi:RNA recognition motif-containing protein